MQIHESIGHPLEIDRIHGREADYAGGSFVQPSDVGRLQYGSPVVNVFGSASGLGVGTLGWDDDGYAVSSGALITGGVLTGLIGASKSVDSEQSPGIAQSSASRSDGAALPLVRMANVDLQPGEGSTDDLLTEMGSGLLLLGNRSFSIDADRRRFHFACEGAWRISNGQRVEMLRAPGYQGSTLPFWRSCVKVAGAAEWQTHSVTFCVKGDPRQRARVGHGAAPALFDAVSYGPVSGR
ncbi:metallopeptidase TldD-related protein [Rhodococcus sp. 06-235-1A]|uniref:metallopeptidase TldD-related protein n=1 Tax=Rhodococcus sp. 06-235-1A TaxID=2022508 RepID=UPI0035946807